MLVCPKGGYTHVPRGSLRKFSRIEFVKYDEEGKQRWEMLMTQNGIVAVGTALLAQLLPFGLTFFCFTLWSTAWSADFALGQGEVMVAISMATLMLAPCTVISGIAIDRFSSKWVIAMGVVLYSLALIVISYSTHFWQIIIIYRSLIPLGCAFCGPVIGQAVAARWFSRHRGMAIGIASTGASLGGLILAPLCAEFLTTYGWRTSHQLFAIPMMVIVLPLVLGLMQDPKDTQAAVVNSSHSSEEESWHFSNVFRSSIFWLISISIVMTAATSQAFLQNIAPFMKAGGLSDNEISKLISIIALIYFIAKIIFGYLSDRIDIYKLSIASFVLMSIGIIMAVGNWGFPGYMTMSIFIGIGGGLIVPLQGVLIGHWVGASHFGRISGFMALIISISAIGPIVSGVVFDYLGSYAYSFLPFVGCLLISGICMQALRRRLVVTTF